MGIIMNACKIGDIVITKKNHPCGNNRWKVIRVGADYKIECLKCGHVVLLSSINFYKAIKEIETK